MELRRYQQPDCKEITELFYHTVHTVNAKDYTKEQLDVWAAGRKTGNFSHKLCYGKKTIILA